MIWLNLYWVLNWLSISSEVFTWTLIFEVQSLLLTLLYLVFKMYNIRQAWRKELVDELERLASPSKRHGQERGQNALSRVLANTAPGSSAWDSASSSRGLSRVGDRSAEWAVGADWGPQSGRRGCCTSRRWLRTVEGIRCTQALALTRERWVINTSSCILSVRLNTLLLLCEVIVGHAHIWLIFDAVQGTRQGLEIWSVSLESFEWFDVILY